MTATDGEDIGMRQWRRLQPVWPIEDYTEAELRESIAYIRSLPTGYRWSWRTLRRERYGPDLTLLSWLSHAEALMDAQNGRSLPETEHWGVDP